MSIEENKRTNKQRKEDIDSDEDQGSVGSLMDNTRSCVKPSPS